MNCGRKFLAGFVLLVVLVGCSDKARQVAGPLDGPPANGWRLAGLSGNEQDSSVLWQMVAVGPNLFARNGYGRLFQGRQGSNEWKPVPLPDSLRITWMYADSIALYLGSWKTGTLFRFDPTSQQLDALQTGYTSPWLIVGIARYGSQILVSVKNSGTNTDWTTLRWDGSKFTEWPGQFGTHDSTTWDAWQDGIEWKGWFYAASKGSGLWRRKEGDSAWQEVPRPSAVNSTTADKQPRCFQIWEDSLFVGYEVNSLYRINLDGSYVDYRNRQTSADSGILEIPVQLYALGLAGDHLLTAGWYSAIPLLYSRRTRHWKYVSADSWCYRKNGDQVCPAGQATYSLVTVGDTLYALGTANVMKIPVSELPAE